MNTTTGKEQRYKNATASGTEKQRQIEAAMDAFGLGAADVAKEHILAVVSRLTIKTMFVYPLHPVRQVLRAKLIELSRIECGTYYYGDEHALITIPRAYVKIFDLADYVLTAPAVESYRNLVERHSKGL